MSQMLGQPGNEITITGLSWPKLLMIIGAIFAGAAVIIGVLIGLVYDGLVERSDTLSKHVAGLDQTFRTAVTAGISVQDLLKSTPSYFPAQNSGPELTRKRWEATQ